MVCNACAEQLFRREVTGNQEKKEKGEKKVPRGERALLVSHPLKEWTVVVGGKKLGRIMKGGETVGLFETLNLFLTQGSQCH